MHTKCTAFGKWYTPRPVHVPYTKPPFGVPTPEGVPPPLLRSPSKLGSVPGSEGVRTPSSIFTEGLSFHSEAGVRGMYAFLIWCTVHVPYTKLRLGVRAVYWDASQTAKKVRIGLAGFPCLAGVPSTRRVH